ncbi:hypothetical protein [Blastococcus xanthinilyticus]|uniref:Uncharacterized protein n=1 Tax=Blastococcus xanthinilyticus TaxID=1564164 RepID=A0A5S5D464_9ACTN|nr:hypothetical protein [Blastococcus xanthinilyticus]TYP90741.1 hypothetical protein BD833_101459 [Blastococcus xanthinilyticus]
MHSNDRPEQAGGSPEGRRRGRLIIPLVIALVLVVIFGWLLIVGLGADEAEEVGAPTPAAVVAAAPA